MEQIKDMTEPELRRLMTGVAKNTEGLLPPGTLFVTLVFDDPGLAQYVSNSERPGIIKAMRECADRLDRKQDIPR